MSFREHRLALLYNNASPHENHHAATAFQLLQQPDLNFLINMPQERKVKYYGSRAAAMHVKMLVFYMLLTIRLLNLCQIQARLRRIVISMVLATDMKQHLGILSSFRSRVDRMAAMRHQAAASGMPNGLSDMPAPGTVISCYLQQADSPDACLS